VTADGLRHPRGGRFLRGRERSPGAVRLLGGADRRRSGLRWAHLDRPEKRVKNRAG